MAGRDGVLDLSIIKPSMLNVMIRKQALLCSIKPTVA